METTPSPLELPTANLQIMEVALRSQLLMDPQLVERTARMSRTFHQAETLPTAVLGPDPANTWEYGGEKYSKRVTLYGTVLRDDSTGIWRMWYMCRMGPPDTSPPHRIPELYCPRDDTKPPSFEGSTADIHGRSFVDNDRGDLTCYAESLDGLTFIKPNVGAVTFNGSLDNNICWDLHGASVFHEPAAPAGHQYTAVGFCRRYRNVFLIRSADGKHWDDTDTLEPVALRDNEGCFNIVYDELTAQYRGFALSRGGPEEVRIKGSTTDTTTWQKRLIFTCTAPALTGPWTPLVPCLRATGEDDAFAQSRPAEGLITSASSTVPNAGSKDSCPLHAEVHNLSAFRCGQLFIGLAGFLYVEGDGANDMPSDGVIESQMVWSHDGLTWHHADEARTPAIPRAPRPADGPTEPPYPGTTGPGFDSGMIIGIQLQSDSPKALTLGGLLTRSSETRSYGVFSFLSPSVLTMDRLEQVLRRSP